MRFLRDPGSDSTYTCFVNIDSLADCIQMYMCIYNICMSIYNDPNNYLDPRKKRKGNENIRKCRQVLKSVKFEMSHGKHN